MTIAALGVRAIQHIVRTVPSPEPTASATPPEDKTPSSTPTTARAQDPSAARRLADLGNILLGLQSNQGAASTQTAPQDLPTTLRDLQRVFGQQRAQHRAAEASLTGSATTEPTAPGATDTGRARALSAYAATGAYPTGAAANTR